MKSILLFVVLLLVLPVVHAWGALALAEVQLWVKQYMDARKHADADVRARLLVDITVCINARDSSSQVRTTEENNARYAEQPCNNRNAQQLTIQTVESLPGGLACVRGRLTGTQTNKAAGS